MDIIDLPKEILCHILSFLRHTSYFNAISSNIFPIDIKQYNINENLKLNSELAQEKEINNRKRNYRITQGKILITSFVKENMPHLQNIVHDNLDDWDDEIDDYFLYDRADHADTTIVTTILDYATQYDWSL